MNSGIVVVLRLRAEARANYGAATEACPLVAVIKAADGLAAHILER